MMVCCRLRSVIIWRRVRYAMGIEFRLALCDVSRFDGFDGGSHTLERKGQIDG